MRLALACLAAVGLLVACSKTPADQSNATPAAAQAPGAPVSGIYVANGQPAVLTDASVRADDPVDGKPVHAFVFTAAPQAEVVDVINDARQGKLGDAIIIRVDDDGSIIGADLAHHGLKNGDHGWVSTVGVLSINNYRVAGGVITGHVTSGGPHEFGGQQINVDFTFHTKAP
jgi:hypothetical protein